ncbi:MAG: hypothetical protein EBR09_05490 [Proteobacteria bacterium]|nr:hypothetical protein [Pseudomonadota bacterium]
MPSFLVTVLVFAVLGGCSASQNGPETTSRSTQISSGSGSSANPVEKPAEDTQTEPPSDSGASGGSAAQPLPKDKVKFGGAIYTTQQPGSYASLAPSHASQLSFADRTLSVVISHDQTKSHYTKWIQVRTVAGDVLSEKLNTAPENTSPTAQSNAPSVFDLGGAELKRDQICVFFLRRARYLAFGD